MCTKAPHSQSQCPLSGETLMDTLDQLQQFADKRGQSEYTTEKGLVGKLSLTMTEDNEKQNLLATCFSCNSRILEEICSRVFL